MLVIDDRLLWEPPLSSLQPTSRSREASVAKVYAGREKPLVQGWYRRVFCGRQTVSGAEQFTGPHLIDRSPLVNTLAEGCWTSSLSSFEGTPRSRPGSRCCWLLFAGRRWKKTSRTRVCPCAAALGECFWRNPLPSRGIRKAVLRPCQCLRRGTDTPHWPVSACRRILQRLRCRASCRSRKTPFGEITVADGWPEMAC